MMTAYTKTVAEMKAGEEGGLYKYVVVNGEYRFASHMFNHSELVDRAKGEQAQGAGLFSVWRNKIRWEDSYSSTLKIGARQQDEDDIGGMFGLPVKSRWDND